MEKQKNRSKFNRCCLIFTGILLIVVTYTPVKSFSWWKSLFIQEKILNHLQANAKNQTSTNSSDHNKLSDSNESLDHYPSGAENNSNLGSKDHFGLSYKNKLDNQNKAIVKTTPREIKNNSTNEKINEKLDKELNDKELNIEEHPGKKLLEGKSFILPAWKASAYKNIWKVWGLNKKPIDFEKQFRERYGLHEAPYPNNNLPMGLRYNQFLLINGISVDCMVCHSGSIFGKSYVGMGNSTGDVHALFEELTAADNRNPRLPFRFSTTRGTSEAAAMAVYLLRFRDSDLNFTREHPLPLKVNDDLCEDVPAWWLLKKKKTMYYTAGASARSVRSKMQFMMTPLTSRDQFVKAEKDFQAISDYLMTLQAPKYPLPINSELANKGKKLFVEHCAKCHGTYDDNWTYPNKIIPIDEIGTDRRRYEGIPVEFVHYYNKSWFAKERTGWFLDGDVSMVSKGYQAPPLDGLWATAPYLHNGSVPTVYEVLRSNKRPKIFTRSYQTAETDYDPIKMGWKYQKLSADYIKPTAPIEARKIYDTRQSGHSNQGHTYGDDLSENEVMELIEYLKTL